MRKYWFLIVLILIPIMPFCQTVIDTTASLPDQIKQIVDAVKNVDSWDDLMALSVPMFAVLWTAIGYLQAFIPKFKTLPAWLNSTSVRVFVFGIIIVFAVVKLGGYSWIAAAVGAFVSDGLYKTVFKWIFPTKKVEATVNKT